MAHGVLRLVLSVIVDGVLVIVIVLGHLFGCCEIDGSQVWSKLYLSRLDYCSGSALDGIVLSSMLLVKNLGCVDVAMKLLSNSLNVACIVATIVEEVPCVFLGYLGDNLQGFLSFEVFVNDLFNISDV